MKDEARYKYRLTIAVLEQHKSTIYECVLATVLALTFDIFVLKLRCVPTAHDEYMKNTVSQLSIKINFYLISFSKQSSY